MTRDIRKVAIQPSVGATSNRAVPLLLSLTLLLMLSTHRSTGAGLSDDFSAATLDPANWTLLDASDAASMVVNSGRLNYVTSAPVSNDDYAVLQFSRVQPGYNESWEVIVDVSNTATRTASGQYTGAGIGILGAEHQDRYDEIFLELGNEHVSSMRFFSNFITDDHDTPEMDAILDANVTSGSLRIAFDGATKVFSIWVDRTGSANGYQWESLTSYGIAGSGGTRNTQWNMTSAGTFLIGLYGLSSSLVVGEGSVTFDNFTFTPGGAGEPPVVVVGREGNSIRLSWPATATGYGVQATRSVVDGDWEAVPGEIIRQGEDFSLLVPITGGAEFFRLAAAQAPVPAGIYMGNFAGQTDNGGFALMVRSNGTAVAVGYNTPQDEGLFISSFTVGDNGGFSAATAQGGSATGTFTSSNVNGTFVNSTGGTGSFSGNRKSDTGTHANNAGYYTGTYSGQFQGSAFAVLAADGSIFFYTIDDPASPTADGDGGGFGTINAANSFSGTTVPLGLTVTGTLNPTTKVISGSYSMEGTALGTFSLNRTSTP